MSVCYNHIFKGFFYIFIFFLHLKNIKKVNWFLYLTNDFIWKNVFLINFNNILSTVDLELSWEMLTFDYKAQNSVRIAGRYSRNFACFNCLLLKAIEMLICRPWCPLCQYTTSYAMFKSSLILTRSMSRSPLGLTQLWCKL